MRSRNIKPQIFTNDLLATADPLYTVIFEGLWCYCDREGQCEDRPSKIHLAINPGRAYERTVEALDWLTTNEFIVRYQVGKSRYISVPKFKKHQNPHYKEPPSKIPPPPMMGEHAQGFNPDDRGDNPGLFDEDTPSIGGDTQGEPEASTPMNGGKARLIPDSGFLIPDSSPQPPSERGASGHTAPREKSPERKRKDASRVAWVKAEIARKANDFAGLRQREPVIAQAIQLLGGFQQIGMTQTDRMPQVRTRFREVYEQLLERQPGEEG